MKKKVYTYHAFYQNALDTQRTQIQTWFTENVIACNLTEGVLLDILYNDFCDKNHINTEKLTKISFAKFLCIILKEKNTIYKTIYRQFAKKGKRMYLGITLPVLQ